MSDELRPLRIEAVLIAARVNEKGETIGEEAVANIKLFAPSFAKLPEVVAEVWPGVLAEKAKLDPAR